MNKLQFTARRNVVIQDTDTNEEITTKLAEFLPMEKLYFLTLTNGIGAHNFTDDLGESDQVNKTLVDKLLQSPDVSLEIMKVIQDFNAFCSAPKE